MIAHNVVSYLVNRMQECTETFSQSQKEYLNRKFVVSRISQFLKVDISGIKSREEKAKLVNFEDDDIGPDASAILHESNQLTWSKNDVFLLEENTQFVQQRENEIQSVVKSISDLNMIFKELATMVTEQVRFY